MAFYRNLELPHTGRPRPAYVGTGVDDCMKGFPAERPRMALGGLRRVVKRSLATSAMRAVLHNRARGRMF
jgi:hypothetical protein